MLQSLRNLRRCNRSRSFHSDYSPAVRAHPFEVLLDLAHAQLARHPKSTHNGTTIEEPAYQRVRPEILVADDLGDGVFFGVPEVVIDLIDRPHEKPWGSGEPSASVVPAAISNAIFAATGVRLRSVPFTPDKVKAAMVRS